MQIKIKNLNDKIISCNKCERLVDFRKKIAKEKRKQYLAEHYWGKGVPGFGDYKAQILILGLAPAAHGANRTGRIFTGDKSATFLYRCLYKTKISNLKNSISINDSLQLNNAYITAALKCVPPGDKPNADELKNCFAYFEKEIFLLKNLKIILALGKVAFDTCIKFFKLKKKDYKFKHGSFYNINDEIMVVACYHPSPRNVNTKRINEEEMVKVLKKILERIKTTS